MGSLIFAVRYEIQKYYSMKLRLIFLLTFLFVAVCALPGKKKGKMGEETDSMSDEMEESDNAGDTVDDENQIEGEPMGDTDTVQGKIHGIQGYGGYGYGRR